jgi:hypothetical protein
LIELGRRLEPLVDLYYAKRKAWASASSASHAEIERKFGAPEERGYRDTPEIAAASAEIVARHGVYEADEALFSLAQEMLPLESAINALPVKSVEGLRAKTIVAFREVAPLSNDSTQFSFDDAYPFQQLFKAVAELCGLNDKIASTGFSLPEVSTDGDDGDEGTDLLTDH